MKIKVTGKLLTNVVVMPFESHAMFAPSILVFSFMPVEEEEEEEGRAVLKEEEGEEEEEQEEIRK